MNLATILEQLSEKEAAVLTAAKHEAAHALKVAMPHLEDARAGLRTVAAEVPGVPQVAQYTMVADVGIVAIEKALMLLAAITSAFPDAMTAETQPAA